MLKCPFVCCVCVCWTLLPTLRRTGFPVALRSFPMTPCSWLPLTLPQQNWTNHCQSGRPNNLPSLCVHDVTELNESCLFFRLSFLPNRSYSDNGRTILANEQESQDSLRPLWGRDTRTSCLVFLTLCFGAVQGNFNGYRHNRFSSSRSSVWITGTWGGGRWSGRRKISGNHGGKQWEASAAF